MEAVDEELRLRDAVRAAALLLDAVEGAPDAQSLTVETAFGRADVVVDERAADVALHRQGATIHVRRDADSDPA